MPQSHHPIIQAAVSGPLVAGTRQRAKGRIGVISRTHCEAAVTQLTQALGPHASVLTSDSPNPIVADWDCCTLNGSPIQQLQDWRSAINAARLAEVDGAFAIGWRDADGTISIARDAIGERTLYYTYSTSGFLCASSIRALLASGLVNRDLHLPAVASFLTFAYLPGRETLVQDVYELLPGEIVQFHDGRVTRRQFWSVPSETPASADESHLRQTLRACLETAIHKRLPQGEPVGVLLSGGLDSSLIVGLARKLHAAPVHTWSVSFGPDYANELPFSSLVAEHCQTEHCILEISPPAVLSHLDRSIGHLSDPIGDPLTVPNSLLFRAAAEQVGVVLNGEGGDPCFGGPKNLPMLLAELYGDYAPQADAPLFRARSYLRAHLKCYDDLSVLLSAQMLGALATAPLEERVAVDLADPRWPTFVTRLQALNVMFKGGHHILPKVDALSFPHGVLARSPLFDRTIVELSFTLPPQFKLRGSVEKYLLKEAVKDLLPPAIIERPKSGMLVPVEGWFQGPLASQARERILDGLAPYELFQTDYLERLLAGRLGGGYALGTARRSGC